MKLKLLYFALLISTIRIFAANVTWTNTTGNNDWNTALNWSTSSVPGASDVAIFDGTNNANATLSAASTIGGITVNGYIGTININGQTFQITSGNCDFTTGTINGGTLSINTTGTVTFAGTTFGAIVNSISARVYLNGSTFNAVTSIEKNGAGNDNCSGGNTFAANTTITNSSTGHLELERNNSDTFSANLDIINSGTSYTILSRTAAETTIAGNLNLTNSGEGDSYIHINYQATATISITGNVTINNTGTGTNSRVFLCVRGTTTIGGNLTINNNATSTSAIVYLAYYDNAQITINGNTTVSNNGSATTDRVYLGNQGDVTFNGTLDITNNSSATNSHIYCNQSVNSNNTYNENITVECTDASCDGVLFGEHNGTGVLAATKTVTIGAGGFISGDLEFRNFTQTGNTAQNLTCTGTARIYNYDSNWGGNVSFTSPRILTRGTTYNGTAYIEKTGTGNDGSVGGNIFVGNTELKNTGSGYFLMGNNNQPDTCRANIIINNEGTSSMYFAYNIANNYIGGDLTINNTSSGTTGSVVFNNSASSTLTIDGAITINNNSTATTGNITLGNNGTTICNGNVSVSNNGANTTKYIYLGNQGDITFNGTLTITNNSSATNSRIFCNYNTNSSNTYNENIIVECTDASCDGIRFGQNGGNGTLAATKTVTIGAGGFIAGQLEFRNFTQTGNTAQNLTCTGTAMIYSYDSDWGGDINFVAPQMVTRGTKYNRTAYLEKTGATHNSSAGGNIFEQNLELKNTGSAYFLMGNGNPDTCRANLIMNNEGTYGMYFAHHSPGNYIAGNLTVNNSPTGANGFCTFTAYSNSTLTIDGTTTINNNSVATSATIDFGSNGTTTCNGNVTVTNNGAQTTKRIYLGNNGDITFNGTLNITNNSSASNSEIYCNYRTASANIYNENIVVESTDANSDGIRFGQGNGTGTLADTKTITIGGSGFIAGYLYFRNFTQTGTTAQSLTCTGTTWLYNYNSEWNGNVNFVAPRQYTRSTTYNGTAYIEKTGAGNDQSYGDNTYNADATLVSNGTNYLLLARNAANDYNADVTYIKSNNGLLYPTYNAASTYAGNININANATVYFGAATQGRVIFDGTGAQSINNLDAAQTFIFRDIQTNNPNDEITLNTPIEISVELDLDAGNIITTSTNLLYMRDNTTVSSVSDDAFIKGPIEKIGNDAFTFPVGDNSMYRPISISAPANTNARFRAEYLYDNPWNHWSGGSGTIDATIDHISSKEYWYLNRIASNNNVNVTLSWKNPESGGVGNLSELLVARWDGTMWKDHGNGGTTGNTTEGTVVTSTAVTSFSPFTLASTNTNNPLPISLLNFNAVLNSGIVNIDWGTETEINNDYFIVEKSTDNINYTFVDKVDGAGNSNQIIDYSTIDKNPYNGISYYRLKQIDLDGNFRYYNPVAINYNILSDVEYKLYPNPIAIGKQLFIEGSEITENINLYLVDIKGNYINAGFSYNQNKIILDTKTLEKGIYFVIIETQEKLYREKFIVE